MTTKTSTAKLKRFADLVDLADSGETEGRLENRGGIWFQIEVEVNPDLPLTGVNQPGTVVFASRSTTRTYPVEDLRTSKRLREAIKRTAAQRAAAAGQMFALRDRSRSGEIILSGYRPAVDRAYTEACAADPTDTGNLYITLEP